MKRIGVFCGSSPGNKPEYTLAAREMGRALAERGIDLVFGGGRVGMMGEIASATLQAGGEVIGVIPKHLIERELAHPHVTRLHVVGSMHERKALMAELAGGFIAMPGGMGTIEEIFEVLTWAQLGLHHKPCGLLNVCGYFDTLLGFLDHVVAEGFLAPAHRQMIVLDTDLGGLLDQFEHYRPPDIDKARRAIEQGNETK